jgi:acyl carrier protein phosphodiesterase
MNYIAHIYLAEHTQTSKLGNFLGDFVKGPDLSSLPVEIQTGIKFHRAIDSYTDSHHQITALKEQFPKQLRRVAGIIIDMYFDHLLLKHWPQGSSTQPKAMFNQFYQQLRYFELPNHTHFTQQKSRLLEYEWLIEYVDRQTCLNAFYTIEKRLKHKITFAEQAAHFIMQNEYSIERSFHAFFPDLLAFGLHWKSTFIKNS